MCVCLCVRDSKPNAEPTQTKIIRHINLYIPSTLVEGHLDTGNRKNVTDVFHLLKWETSCAKYCRLPTDISAHQLVRPHGPSLNSGQPCNHGCSLDSLKGQRRHLRRPLRPATSTNCHSPNMSVTIRCQVHFSSAPQYPVHLVQDRRTLSDLDYGSHLTS